MNRLFRELLVVAAAVAGGACAEEPTPPNLLFISVDTLRADHTSLHGYRRDTTPALADWARGGTVFDRAYSMSSWTLPSMSMLLTGQVQVKNEGRVFPRQTPLAELLRSRGYRTGAVVSNQLLTSERGFDRGFDDYQLYQKPGDGVAMGWYASEVNARGIEFMERGREPFFLLLHYFDPHGPYRPQDGLAFPIFDHPARKQFFREALPPEKRDGFTDEDYRAIEYMIGMYDSEVRQTDRALEELFRWLRDNGLEENTLVVFTSDHGECLWQRPVSIGEEERGRIVPALYFEHGVQLYEEAVHVPLVFRGPGVPSDQRVDAPVSLIDVVPTLLALLDVPAPQMLSGTPLLPEPPPAGSRPIFSICSRGQTVRLDDYRYHRPNDYKVEQGAVPELYDLESDPFERRPIDDPERAGDLRSQVEAWVAAYSAIDWGEVEPIDRETLEREMAKLGYTLDEMIGEGATELFEEPEESEGAGGE